VIRTPRKIFYVGSFCLNLLLLGCLLLLLLLWFKLE
jgi:hypothetical protein